MIDDLIQLAQISGRMDTLCQLGGQWKIQHSEQSQQAVLHLLTAGSAFFNGLKLEAGDIIFLPRSPVHELHSEKALFPTTIETQLGLLNLKTNHYPVETELLCATFYYEKSAFLMDGLPDFIHFNIRELSFPEMIDLIRRENQNEGSLSLINYLSQVLLIDLLRTYFKREKSAFPTGIFKAVQHPKMGKCLRQLFAEPEKNWDLNQMAEMVHLSRSQFIRLFKQQLNTTPHQFLQMIRLQKAGVLLKNSPESILQIALQLGFSSETHFGRLFKRFYGLTPNQYRIKSIS